MTAAGIPSRRSRHVVLRYGKVRLSLACRSIKEEIECVVAL
jgi:hypothetical protein